ncbi:MAG: calcineurin-like phosphoesterase C-terminal domain-containing protein, partial [Planctomycetota bacterium]
MKLSHILVAVVAGLVLLALVLWSPFLRRDEAGPPAEILGEAARGVVFHDRNGNGVRDEGERGVPGVRVSDQYSVTETDERGQWALPIHDAAVYFVIKPRGYMTALSRDNIPSFYYLHKDTEPLDLQGPTIPRSGPLPESIDFPLVRQAEPDRFEAIFMGDPQPRNHEEVDYFAHDVLEELAGTSAAFAVTLGDITFDALDLYPHITQATGTVGIPFYNTHGNHDANYDGRNTYEHFETWRTVFGPRYYSFDYGPVHFVILSDVLFPELGTSYITGLGEDQLQWLEEDLSYVPQDQLVVLAMHIPLTGAEDTPDFGRLYELLEDRPYTLSFSAHSHTLAHGFVTEDYGWLGPEPHHHINAGATCGRWWGGARDETDIPHATGSDGTPNGYFVVTFDGHEYSTRYKAARRPADYQMQVQVPEVVAQGQLTDTPVLVNIFSGSERSSVEMSVGDGGEWTELRFAPQVDPLYVRVTNRESGQRGSVAYHMWEGSLPADLPLGGHLVRVRTTDMHGQEFTGS